MLTVSMPTWRTPPDLLRRAIDGVLAQTYRDLRLVVVRDGGPPLVDLPSDSRLDVLELPNNRGRYFADAVVLAATDDGWFAVHDADDVAEPEMYDELVEAAEGGAALAPFWRHDLRRTDPYVQQVRLSPPTSTLRHVGHWCAGVYSVSRLRASGGIHPGYRLGYDTLAVALLALTGPIGVAPTPRWHWHRRYGSLTSANETRLGSSARADVKRRLAVLYRSAWDARQDRSSIADVIADDVDPGLAAEVTAWADRLRDPDRPGPSGLDASDLIVTVLTGRRPRLLETTLTSTRQSCPGLLETARVVALANGGDVPTLAVLEKHADVIDERIVTSELEPIGPAISQLARVAADSDRPLWLHLEDDWTATPDVAWLDRARSILDRDSSIGQVRLRRSDERVLTRHMVTSRPIRWSDRSGWRRAPEAHLTFNPAIMRTGDIPAAFPADSETDAQQRFHDAGRRAVAQVVPGVWRHAGGDDSLRARTGAGRPWRPPSDPYRRRLATG